MYVIPYVGSMNGTQVFRIQQQMNHHHLNHHGAPPPFLPHIFPLWKRVNTYLKFISNSKSSDNILCAGLIGLHHHIWLLKRLFLGCQTIQLKKSMALTGGDHCHKCILQSIFHFCLVKNFAVNATFSFTLNSKNCIQNKNLWAWIIWSYFLIKCNTHTHIY